MPRTLSPYEINHLTRRHINPETIDQYGEMPVEYITGEVDFGGHIFKVTRETLIPRLETEELVDLAFRQLQKFSEAKPSESLIVADVGCGCGAIGLSLVLKAQTNNFPNPLEIYMSDISEPAVKVAQENAALLLPKGFGQHNLHFFPSDLLDQYPDDFQADLLVANLPYIPSDRINSLDSCVKDFEPFIALDGGSEGLSLIHRFLTQAPHHLKPSGMIILEIDYTHTPEELQANQTEFKVNVITDQFLRQRFALITRL